MICNKISLFLVYLFLAGLYPNAPLAAQSLGFSENIQFEEIFNPAGPESNMANRMVQDSAGFIWFPTPVGLYRYDGTNFRLYPLSTNGGPADTESLLVDRQGNYWVGGFGGGLYRMNPETGAFQNYVYRGNEEAASPSHIGNLAEGPEGKIWLATREGVFAFNPEVSSFEHYDKVEVNGVSLPIGYAETVLVDRSGNSWVGAGYIWGDVEREDTGGLLKFNVEENAFDLLLPDTFKEAPANSFNISSLYEDKQGNIWIGTADRELFKFDPVTHTFQQIPLRLRDLPTRPVWSILSDITQDCHGRFWLGVTHDGMYLFDPADDSTRYFAIDPAHPTNGSANNAWKFLAARDGSIYVSSGRDEGYVKRFEPCTKQNYEGTFETFLAGDQVNEIVAGAGEEGWIGTQDNGLFRYQSSGLLRAMKLDSGEKSIKALHQDRKGNLWIGCWPQPCGLLRLNLDSGTKEVLRKDPENPNKLSSDLIMDILEDRTGNIWIATWGGGLNRYDPVTGISTQYRYDPLDSTSLGGNFVTSLYEDPSGIIWVGGGGTLLEPSEPAFLDRFLPTQEVFEHHFHGMEVEAFSEVDAITDITGAPNGALWISKRGVIVRFDPKSGSKQLFARSRDYNWYWSIHLDSNGGVWSTSLDGLAHLNPTSSNFTVFPWHTLPVSSNWWQPIEGLGDDRFLVGGQGGFMQFSGQHLLAAKVGQLPDVILDRFENQGEALLPKYLSPAAASLREAKQITLPPEQNIFSLSLKAPYFQKDQPISIEYMLHGYDLNWKIADQQGLVSYFKVPPGSYTLKARVRSANGLVTEPSLNMDIVILTPWWQRWWVLALFLLALMILSYFSYRAILRRKLALVEARKLKEMDALKNRLYTNITHEFRTPLTVISGITDEIEGHEKEKRLIQRNSNQLLGLVNQILRLQKLESKKTELRPVAGDVARFLNYLVESFQSLAQRKHLQLVFYADPATIPMDFDEEKMQQLVSNLIFNAIKFTPDYGKVELGLTLIADGKEIRIKIRDTGVGMPEDQLKHIFDRFHQSENQGNATEGTGIGLALVSELIKLMSGRIEVESQVGQGTTFTVFLPRPEVEASDQLVMRKPTIDSAFLTPLEESTGFVPGNSVRSVAGDPYILLVEDNQDVAYYLERILRDQYRIGLARNGAEGMEKALEEIPDMVISDVMMPQMDGFAFCAKLKRDLRTSHIPVILLTAKATQGERLEGLKAGADAYLAKPFDKEELLIRIEKLLDLRRKIQQNFWQKDARHLPDYQDAFLDKLHQAVKDNLGDEDFGTLELCRAMAMSRTQLHRKIKALLDIPTARFIQLTRLHRARQLILTTDKSIGEVSFETGFKDPSYFTKLYAAEFEEMPSETRK
ncbi:ATP-binding protein [Cyclobacterium jeungdonense]|uniref:histidine kinase n=1 Tax=Cyclobacterium jeungdonense TaxID=708087 RepID=A0ABT8C5Q2_9BACT|nr:ATP-binding protein [Cyclobacterium jeungdonense]MDN3687016.1 ATP-binding protein [Cyclobacterium jeungdonense]